MSVSFQPTRKTLLGLMSRWTTPRSCAAASASNTGKARCATAAGPNEPRDRRSSKVSPSSHSMAMKGDPWGAVPRSK